METIGGYTQGLCRHNGRENGNYYLGLSKEFGKAHYHNHMEYHGIEALNSKTLKPKS